MKLLEFHLCSGLSMIDVYSLRLLRAGLGWTRTPLRLNVEGAGGGQPEHSLKVESMAAFLAYPC